jgi:hypothetical protein
VGIHSPEWALQKPYALCALKTEVVNRDLRLASSAKGTSLPTCFVAFVLLKTGFLSPLAIRSAPGLFFRANNDQIRVIRREKYISIPIDGFPAIFANRQWLEAKPVTGGWDF